MDSQDTVCNQARQDGDIAQPDPQTLYQQQLAHWQAAFQEYWKCMASQSAAMPQQWAAQAMMGAGYGGMQYLGSGFLNPYGVPMGADAAVPPPGSTPAASMPGQCAPVPVSAPMPAATATTGTSSQAGLNGAGLDSDADSRLTADDDPADLLHGLLDPPAAVASPPDSEPIQEQGLAPLSLEQPQPDAPAVVTPAAVPGMAAAASTPALAGIPAPAGPPAVAVAGLPVIASRLPAPKAGLAAPLQRPLSAPASTVPLPTSGLIAAPTPSSGPVGLPFMGLTQSSTLGCSQAALQLSSMADHTAGLTHAGLIRHHSATLSLLGDDGTNMDDRDLKRLRRKQSNRESARRSRLRKQAENDTLQQRLHDCEAQRNTLMAENAALKQRMEQLTIILAKLSQDKAALLTQVTGLGGQIPAELETTSLTAISTISADAMQQQLAAAAVVSQAVAASQAAVAPAAALPTPAATLAAVAGLQEQMQPRSVQLQGLSVAAPHTVVVANGGGAEVATAILASA